MECMRHAVVWLRWNLHFIENFDGLIIINEKIK